jgi:hypothetical protein
MRRNTLWGVAAIVVTFSLVQSFAQEISVPPLIKFESVLRNAAGQALAGVQGVTFGLYEDKSGGVPLWLETQNVNSDDQGRFVALLGATTGRGVPLDLFAAGKARWLSVRANSSEQEQERILLLSVPYSLKASDADTLGGKPLSAFVLASNDQSAPVSSNMSKADDVVVSALTQGTPGRLALFDTDTTSLKDSVITQSSAGLIGVGTGSPTSNFHISTGGSDVTFNMENTGTGGRAYRWDSTNNSSFFGGGRLVMQDINSGGLARMSIDANGFVGFGTAFPGSNLDVVGNNQDMTFNFNNTGPGGHSYRWDSTNSNSGFGGGRLVLQDVSVGGLARFSIDGNGLVGIGTATPAEKLDVTGNIQAAGTVSGTRLISSVATGTAPLTVSSTTQVANLNASLLGGLPASSFGDITGVTAGAGLTGGATSGNASVALNTAALTRGVTYLAGCDTCSVLVDTDDQKTIYFNVVGSMTINSVTCFSNVGTPTINILRDDGTAANVLNSDLACSPSGTTSTDISVSEATLNLNEKLDFAILNAGLTTNRVTVSIKLTVN